MPISAVSSKRSLVPRRNNSRLIIRGNLESVRIERQRRLAPSVKKRENRKMTIETTREILGWCAIINLGLLLWWVLLFTLAHDWMYRLHGKWCKLSQENFDAIHYLGMSVFKIGILLLNLVPYFALRIVG